MHKTRCGHCGVFAHMTAATDFQALEQDEDTGEVKVSAAFTCDNCGRMSVAEWWEDVRGYFGFGGGGKPIGQNEMGAPIWNPPPSAQSDQFEDVPRHIAEAASEATGCQSAGFHRAAGALARAVIEATAKDKGASRGNLQAKIQKLEELGFVRATIAEGAHEVRHLGNDMAHGDFAEAVDAEDVDLSLTLMREVLADVYQHPARLERAKEKRIAKRAGRSDPAF